MIAPLERALHRNGEGERRVIVRRRRGVEEDLALFVRQNWKIRRREVVGDSLGVRAGQEAAHAAMRVAGVVHPQGRQLLAVEPGDLGPQYFHVGNAAADGDVDDDADTSADRYAHATALGERWLVALDHDRKAAFTSRSIGGYGHLEAVAQGSAPGYLDLRPFDSDPRAAAARLQRVVEVHAEIRRQGPVRGMDEVSGGGTRSVADRNHAAQSLSRLRRQ